MKEMSVYPNQCLQRKRNHHWKTRLPAPCIISLLYFRPSFPVLSMWSRSLSVFSQGDLSRLLNPTIPRAHCPFPFLLVWPRTSWVLSISKRIYIRDSNRKGIRNLKLKWGLQCLVNHSYLRNAHALFSSLIASTSFSYLCTLFIVLFE